MVIRRCIGFNKLLLLLLLLLKLLLCLPRCDDPTKWGRNDCLLLRRSGLFTFPPFNRFTFLVVFFHTAIDHFKLALNASRTVSFLAGLVFFRYNVRYFLLLFLFGLLMDAVKKGIQIERGGEKMWKGEGIRENKNG